MKTLSMTPEQRRALMARSISGPVVMLNLLRFRDEADYREAPALAPAAAITGKEAYRRYMEHVAPLLEARRGSLRFSGEAGAFAIGPSTERWDWALLVAYPSMDAFWSFVKDPEYLAGVGHRMAALEDSRLLPLVEGSF